MTTIVKTVVTDALEDILNRSSEEPIEAEDALAGMRYLNRLMASLAVRGINLGFTEVSKLTDVVTIADGAVDGITAMLSKALSAKFKVDVHGSVLDRIKDGWAVILTLSSTNTPRSYPDILPIGSGNEPSACGVHFYTEPDDAIYSEVNGSILLEDDTEGA